MKATILPRKPHHKSKAQGMLEFALALPVLLLMVFGIIEFGRLMQAWLALENGARFAVRYAVTGNYDPQYCQDAADSAATDFGMTADALRAQDHLDGQYDCMVPDTKHSGVADWEPKTNALQDWARLLSIRDSGLAGATGIAWDSSVSGDYKDYLKQHPNNIASWADRLTYLGDPDSPDYFLMSICSNRKEIEISKGFATDPYPTLNYPDFCARYTLDSNGNPSSLLYYMDDAGGPGDRVRVTLTYRHTLITPFLSTWWPTLRLTSTREGLVEKFRASRVTGLTGGIAAGATWTPTATDPPPTPTFTPTVVYQCSGSGVLYERWDNIPGSDVTDLTNSMYYVYPDVNYYSYNDSWIGNNNSFWWPQTSPDANDYGMRFRGRLCVPMTADYTFYMVSDDQAKFYLNTSPGFDLVTEGNLLITSAYASGQTPVNIERGSNTTVHLIGGSQYYFEVFLKESGGGDYLGLGWMGPTIGDGNTPTLIDRQYLTPVPRVPPVMEAACNGTGPIVEFWRFINTLFGITGSGQTDLTKFMTTVVPNSAPMEQYYPNQAYSYVNKWDNYGSNMRALVCAPYTGNYTFYIVSDDASQLFLSPDDNPSNKVKIAQVNSWAGFLSGVPDWYKETNQHSSPKTLQAGEWYYIEASHIEGSGGDDLVIGWQPPNLNSVQVIAGKYLKPLTARPTRTPSVVSCNDVVPQKPQEAEYMVNNNKQMYVPLKNNNVYYDAYVTRISGTWDGDWHNTTMTRPVQKLASYSMTNPSGTITMYDPTDLTLTANMTWDHTMANQGLIPFMSTGTVALNSTVNWGNANAAPVAPVYPTGSSYNFYHGDDFDLTVYYTIGGLDCSLDVTGLRGPTLEAAYRTGTSGKFNVEALSTAAGSGRTMDRVWFGVYQNGALIHSQVDTTYPYCMFDPGNTGSTCPTNLASYVWNVSGKPVSAGAYTVTIQAQDANSNWTNSAYNTRILYAFNVTTNLPTPVTPSPTPVTPTNTPTNTATPVTPTPVTPTNTATPKTPTAIIPTLTPSKTPTPVATTEVPPPACPPEGGGCH